MGCYRKVCNAWALIVAAVLLSGCDEGPVIESCNAVRQKMCTENRYKDTDLYESIQSSFSALVKTCQGYYAKEPCPADRVAGSCFKNMVYSETGWLYYDGADMPAAEQHCVSLKGKWVPFLAPMWYIRPKE